MFAFTSAFYDELASRLFVLLEKQFLSASKAATVTNDTDTVLDGGGCRQTAKNVQ